MSKSVVLVLKSGYEQDYGEYANTPVFNAHGEIIGWTGGEVPEYEHPCEFNALNDDGFTSCASSATVNRLRDENTKLREQINKLKKLVWQYNSALNCLLKTGICTRQCVACWTFMDPAWLEDRMRELGIEVEE